MDGAFLFYLRWNLLKFLAAKVESSSSSGDCGGGMFPKNSFLFTFSISVFLPERTEAKQTAIPTSLPTNPVETHLSSTAAYNTIFVCEGSDNIDKMPKPVLRFFLFHFEKKDFLPKNSASQYNVVKVSSEC